MAFKNFWEQNYYLKVGQKAILKWGSFDNLLFQSGASVISKWAETVISKWVNVYFKVGHLHQSGKKCYFKVGQLFPSGA